MFERIILEFDNFCNRKCNWCLQTKFKDNSFKMSDEIFKTTINEIYKNIHLFRLPLTFSLFRYNEPLINLDILIKRAKIIKKFFNIKNIQNFLYIHINGDFLTLNVLEKLNNYIDEIRINDYDNLGIVNILEKINNISKEIKFLAIKNVEHERKQLICKYKNIILIFYINSAKNLLKMTKGSIIEISDNNNWLFPNKIRDYKCDMKGKILVVESNGDIMGCCEVSNKFDKHKNFIICNIKDNIPNNIFSLYKNINELTEEACKYCHMSSKYCELFRHKIEVV